MEYLEINMISWYSIIFFRSLIHHQLSSNIMILGDRFTLCLTYYIKMNCLYCRYSFSLIDDNLLVKRLYFPFDCNIYVFRVFQISLLQIVLSEDRY